MIVPVHALAVLFVVGAVAAAPFSLAGTLVALADVPPVVLLVLLPQALNTAAAANKPTNTARNVFLTLFLLSQINNYHTMQQHAPAVGQMRVETGNLC